MGVISAGWSLCGIDLLLSPVSVVNVGEISIYQYLNVTVKSFTKLNWMSNAMTDVKLVYHLVRKKYTGIWKSESLSKYKDTSWAWALPNSAVSRVSAVYLEARQQKLDTS